MSQDMKKQVVGVCEALYASGVELKKITGRLVAKDTEFSHTSVTPFVKEWRENQYKRLRQIPNAWLQFKL